MRSVFLAMIVGLAVAVPLARSFADDKPSFDCARARIWSEKLVCGDPSLASLDRQIADTYRQLIGTWQGARRAGLISGQGKWLWLRDRGCELASAQSDCLAGAMAARLEELKASASIPHTQVTILGTLGLIGAPHPGTVVDMDVESLFDLPIALHGYELDLRYQSLIDRSRTITVRTCRELRTLSDGWAHDGNVPPGINADQVFWASERNCKVLEFLRIAHAPTRSYLPENEAFLDLRRYGVNFLMHGFGFRNDDPVLSVPGEITLGAAADVGQYRLFNWNVLSSNGARPPGEDDDDMATYLVSSSQGGISVVRPADGFMVFLEPQLRGTFGDSDIESVIIRYGAGSTHSAVLSFEGYYWASVVQPHGAIVRVAGPGNLTATAH